MLIGSLRKRKEEGKLRISGLYKSSEHFDKDMSKEIELKEAVILGGILSINNIGIGIGASVAGLNIFVTSLMSLIFSMFLLSLDFI